MQKPTGTPPRPPRAPWLPAEFERIAGLESAVDQAGEILLLKPRLEAAGIKATLDDIRDDVRKTGARLKAARAMAERSAAPAAVRGLEADATHAQLGRALLARLGGEMVWDEGAFWVLNSKTCLWERRDREMAEAAAAETFGDGFFDHARRDNDYSGIARAAAKLARRERFFAEAPHGLAIGRRFLRIEGRAVVEEVLNPEHRQRWALTIEPRSGPPTWLLAHLTRHVGARQIRRVQEALGAILFGVMNDYKKALWLVGLGDTGKSMILQVLERLLPPGAISAVPPHLLGDPTRIVELAGKRLNSCGEVEANKLVSETVYKQLTGGDLISGRAPYRDGIEFHNRAALAFSCNKLPAVRERSDAFYARTLLVQFDNPLRPGEIDRKFAAKLVEAEGAEIVGWAIEGARRLLRRGSFAGTGTIERVAIDRWRKRHDNVLAFLTDPDSPVEVTGQPAHQMPTLELWRGYHRFCDDGGGQSLGKYRFLEELEAPILTAKGVKRDRKRATVSGIREKSAKVWRNLSVVSGGDELTPANLQGRRKLSEGEEEEEEEK